MRYLLTWFVLSLIFTVCFAGHNKDYSWMGYCCGEHDCRSAVVSIIQFQKEFVVVSVNGIVLTLRSSAVKESEDGHTYWCAIRIDKKLTEENTRCVFYTIGS